MLSVGRGAEPVLATEAGRPDCEAVAASDEVQTAAVRHAQAARQDGAVARRRRTEERHHGHGDYYRQIFFSLPTTLVAV